MRVRRVRKTCKLRVVLALMLKVIAIDVGCVHQQNAHIGLMMGSWSLCQSRHRFLCAHEKNMNLTS